jgi:hypothetical protein
MPGGALVVAISVITAAAVTARRHRGDGRLLALQIMLGGVTVWSRRAVLPTTAHLVTAPSPRP